MQSPSDPISAVTHPDPYPYYGHLVAEQPLYFDDTLDMWVASSATAVATVLSSNLCTVRPSSEPVPTMLAGSAAGATFRRLVRMVDGEYQTLLKRAVSATLTSVDYAQASDRSRDLAHALLSRRDDTLTDFMFALPVHVMGSLLGVPGEMLPQTTRWVRDFAGSLAPGADGAAIERGAAAVEQLSALLVGVLDESGTGLLSRLADAVQLEGIDEADVAVANAIGFMFQSYDATAGLIGNSLLALALRPEMRSAIISDTRLLQSMIPEVLRFDAPVQNTRRFVADDGDVGGQAMQAGDAILVVLAAANRDPALNPHPERFDLYRETRRMFSFGAGTHSCPGDALAMIIAWAGIEALVGSAGSLDNLPDVVSYRPSVNARIPLLSTALGACPRSFAS